ncbi:MAG: hypothetical protein QXL57_08845 [Candidatus Bathyarchaeia archaeon]
MKTKRRYVIKQKICKTASVMLIWCYILAILESLISKSLFPLLLVSLCDYAITVLPSFFIKEKEET